MKYPEKVLLRVPSGTLAAIDSTTQNRSDWMRDAIAVALSKSHLQPPSDTHVHVCHNLIGLKRSTKKRPVAALHLSISKMGTPS
jgi:hypothetical protein